MLYVIFAFTYQVRYFRIHYLLVVVSYLVHYYLVLYVLHGGRNAGVISVQKIFLPDDGPQLHPRKPRTLFSTNCNLLIVGCDILIPSYIYID
jgi:hypothetical protein